MVWLASLVCISWDRSLFCCLTMNYHDYSVTIKYKKYSVFISWKRTLFCHLIVLVISCCQFLSLSFSTWAHTLSDCQNSITTNFQKKRVSAWGYQPLPPSPHFEPIPYLCLPNHAGGLGVLGQLGHCGNVVVEPGLIHCWFGLSLCCCPGIKPWSDY